MADKINQQLGRLITVPLREIWSNEASDFTPWLADKLNLDLLSDTLQLGELTVQGIEMSVGNFYIDILARDESDSIVLIENQLETTDHTHLGQILTYLGGQEGKATIIWIAERFRDEHRAAIDWLNGNTTGDFNFFGVELEVLRIGTSTAAPRFNVAAKPNAWSRNLNRTARDSGPRQLNDRQRAYSEYWAGLSDWLKEKHANFQQKTKQPIDYWCSFYFVKKGFMLVTTVRFRDRRMATELYIDSPSARVAFDLLFSDRIRIEDDFGQPLSWQRTVGKTAARVEIVRTDLDPSTESQRPQQYEWFRGMLDKFVSAFSDRVKTLQFDKEEGLVGAADEDGDTAAIGEGLDVLGT
jgi:hypothetical protein